MTWTAGDLIVVLGATEDNATKTLNTPTATGLTFAAVPGSPTNLNGNCKMYAWTATAGSSGSGAITATNGDAVQAGYRGLAAFVFTGSNGIGNTSMAAGLGAATTQSLVRGSNNSAVVQVWGDWGAGNDVTVTWTPSGETQRVAQFNSGIATFFVASWGDQGEAGSTPYGFSLGNATDMSAITIEVKGSSGPSNIAWIKG